MYLLMHYPGGVLVEGIVMGQMNSRLRVAAAGFTDAVELRRSGKNWFTLESQVVELEFLMSCDHPAETDHPAEAPVHKARGKRLTAAS